MKRIIPVVVITSSLFAATLDAAGGAAALGAGQQSSLTRTITLTGWTTAGYEQPTVADNTLFDATQWTSTAVGPSPTGTTNVAVEIGPKDSAPGVNKATGVKNVTWRGGVIVGSIPAAWNWRTAHSFSGAGVVIHNNGFAEWQYLRVHNVEDGIKAREAPEWSHGGSWLVRDSYFTAIRDDSIENDRFEPGTVQDCLFDGVHTFISEQKERGFLHGGGNPVSIGPDEDTVINVKRVYVRLHPTNAFDPNDKDERFPGGGKWFKWSGDNDRAPNHKLRVEDSVFAVGAVPARGWGNLRIPPEVAWVGDNNFILWLGKPGEYGGPKPAGVTFIEGQAARDKWVEVRNNWLTRHGLPAQDFPADYNPHTAPITQIPVSTESVPTIFPEPQEMKRTTASFRLDDEAVIALPAQPASGDIKLATLLMRELSDRHGIAIKTVRVSKVPENGRVIVLGSIDNPLVRAEIGRSGLSVTAASPGPEGYVLRVTDRGVLVAGSDDAGAFYGVQSLRQLIRGDAGHPTGHISGIDVRDWPVKPFRGLRIFLPGRDNLGFFHRFVTDFMGLYKFNKLVLEVNAGMRLERHPELNAGLHDLVRDLDMSRRDRPTGPHGELQDSVHHDTADRGVLEKDEVAAIVRLAEENHIEVIPEIPSLTHSYYLLTRHRELAEVPHAEWPDTYCPSNPASYELLFDVMDEYIEVMKPKMVHIGHDEWRNPVEFCLSCRRKDHTELFLADLNKIYNYLKAKNIRTVFWGDHMIEPLRGRGYRVAGQKPDQYVVPGAVSDEQVRTSIPKDILVFNWFWRDVPSEDEENPDSPPKGEPNDIRVMNWGFEQIYGNFGPGMRNYEARRSRKGVLGGAASLWSATTELNVAKDALFEFVGTAPMLWSTKQIPDAELLGVVQSMMPEVRRRLSGQEPPSSMGDPIRTIEVARTGAASVSIGEDASSLIFVHAAARPGTRGRTGKMPYNAADTNELLGAYEVVYEDGLVVSVPVRYAWNILERNWPADPGDKAYCYAADARPAPDGMLFALEWPNPRLGKVIKEVRLWSSTESNPVTLDQVQVVGKLGFPDPGRARMFHTAGETSDRVMNGRARPLGAPFRSREASAAGPAVPPYPSGPAGGREISGRAR